MKINFDKAVPIAGICCLAILGAFLPIGIIFPESREVLAVVVGVIVCTFCVFTIIGIATDKE